MSRNWLNKLPKYQQNKFNRLPTDVFLLERATNLLDSLEEIYPCQQDCCLSTWVQKSYELGLLIDSERWIIGQFSELIDEY